MDRQIDDGKNNTIPQILLMRGVKTRAVTKCDLVPPPALWQKTSILDSDEYTDSQMDKQADSSIPPENTCFTGTESLFQ